MARTWPSRRSTLSQKPIPAPRASHSSTPSRRRSRCPVGTRANGNTNTNRTGTNDVSVSRMTKGGGRRDSRSSDGIIEGDPKSGDNAGIPKSLQIYPTHRSNESNEPRTHLVSIASVVALSLLNLSSRHTLETHHPKVKDGRDEQPQPDQALQLQLFLQTRA
jgi:hypothetical protein